MLTISLIRLASLGLALACLLPGSVRQETPAAETKHYLRPTEAASVDPMSMDMATILASGTQVGSRSTRHSASRATPGRPSTRGSNSRWRSPSRSRTGWSRSLRPRTGPARRRRAWMIAERTALRPTRQGRETRAPRRARQGAGSGASDGRKHRAGYDVHGRVWQVEREGIANVRYSYDATSGLMLVEGVPQPCRRHGHPECGLHSRTDRSGHAGAAHRRPGRHHQHLHLLLRRRHAEQSERQDEPRPADGRDGYGKSFGYRADGLLTKRTVALNGWRTIENVARIPGVGDARFAESTASDDGRDRVRAAPGLSLRRLRSARPGGRERSTLATYAYGGNGELVQAAFTTGDVVNFEYDTTTRRRTGYSQGSGRYAASTNQWTNARGLIDSEAFSVGATTLARTYGYSSSGS